MRIWKEFGIKTHNFTNPLLVHISAHNLYIIYKQNHTQSL